MVVTHSCLIATPAQREETSIDGSVRDWVRNFSPPVENSRLVVWNPSLEVETGAGICVALLDSGIYWPHPMFQGATLEVRDFTGTDETLDPTGHGTQDAGLLVGQGQGHLLGLAPACTLLVGKVIGTGNPNLAAKALAQGIRWAASNGADLIVMPLGRSHSATIVARATRAAKQQGCQLLAAAGNRGADNYLFPARLKDVTSVSAVDCNGYPLESCCHVPQVQLYALGEISRWGSDTSLGQLRGSSLATVLAAGILALRLAQERRLHPSS